MQIVCRVAGHQRSSRRARFDFEAQRWTSVCKHCDGPMVRVGERNWQLAESNDRASSLG